jgi:hypothetical protein
MKKNRNYLVTIIFVLTAFVLFQTSCNKDDDLPDGTADFSVSMESSTTVRSNYEAVNIDIQNVSIHISADTNETSGWDDLETNTGIYDLLDFAAGNDTIIALDSVLQVQTVSQIRLLLGENNTVVENGVTYDLDTPSAQTSGLKIQVHAPLEPNKIYKVVLDFDADQSIIKTGNDKYKLKPVINATLVEL